MPKDSILIQHGRAHEIWRGKSKSELPPFTPSLLDSIVEADSGAVNEGDQWDGVSFTPPSTEPETQATVVPYVILRARLTDAEKETLHMAMAADWRIDDFVGLARAQNFIDLSIIDEAKTALIAAGVFTPERADIIFSA